MNAQARPVDETLVRLLPKAEVHVHLEGCFDLADLLELAKAAGVGLPGPAATLFDVDTHDVPAEAPGAPKSTLSAFLRFLDWEGGLVRTPEQAARAAYRFAARESASGVRYADVIVNPTHWGAWHGRLGELFAAFAAGLDEAEQDGLAVVNLCASLLRQQTPAAAAELVDWLVEARPVRVVALSIDGDERAAGRTGPRFADAFRRAADAGIRRTVHAGESSGPQGVWDALDLLRAERIDHGVRAAEDPALLRRLVDERVPLGVCPRSNLALGLYPDRASHPLPALLAAGVAVTVNTDDPAAMGYRLEAEWAACADAYGWGLAEVAELARASVRASFAPPELAASLLADIDAFEAGRA
ncbi:adenosine deaminase [Frankia sp. CNm7]|uniref:Adenosine deaminase n=2 Tax=Frankia nepalensis TaxID=1836974 RepID=A0A937RTC0_9ACTN|nr:adenosine deaminase [Frankia nepalensis]MBL7515606.1 adenosine deaminase [Frankia nepalensis]MBL7524141.1 adenosine deaminase [Frankia nepalensis]MBL7632408.1 adenosine deaminase [Frankia nepalensis]